MKTSFTKDSIIQIQRGTSEIINGEALEEKLNLPRKLRVKAGFDPTAPDIHLGHVVLLRKLRQFQDLGHIVDFVIGDFTALVGDPTGKNKLRPRLDAKFIKSNAQTYQKQVFKILDPKRTNVVFNSSWLGKMSSYDMLKLSAHSTVAQMLARSDFKKRFEDGKEISILEFIYPLLQGYDSVHLKSDIELGGADQRFNLLMGRQLQEVYNESPQVVIMTPLLEGTDGIQKMSKSLNNYIGINEKPAEIFGKIMSINDTLMFKYYECLTDVCTDVVKKQMHPKEAKLNLGTLIVEQFYNKKQAEKARIDFENTFSQGNISLNMPEVEWKNIRSKSLIDILISQELVDTKNESRRMIAQDAVSLDGVRINNEDWKVKKGILKVGKKRFLRIL